MICSKCGNLCYAMAGHNNTAVSYCCGANIEHDGHHHYVNITGGTNDVPRVGKSSGEKCDQSINHRHYFGNEESKELSFIPLRDYFAAKAMQMIISAGEINIEPDDIGKSMGKIVAEQSYKYADAMLAEREK